MILPKNAVTTSNILSFFNDLFDSFNGRQGQGLGSVISLNSGHIELWNEADRKLRNMKYVDKNTRQVPKKKCPEMPCKLEMDH